MPRLLFVLAIDMHVHSTTTTPLELARLASLSVRDVFLAALQSDLAMWSTVDPARYLPALIFPCAGGRSDDGAALRAPERVS